MTCWQKGICCVLSVFSVEIRTLNTLKYLCRPLVNTGTYFSKGGYEFDQVLMKFTQTYCLLLN